MRTFWTGISVTPKAASVCGALLVSVVSIAAWSRPAAAVPDSPAPAARAPVASAPQVGVNPVLTHVPALATLAPNAPTIVSLTVNHIADGATVRLEGENYVYTFGRDALVAAQAHVVDLSITGVEPGTYLVSITNPDGLHSTALPLVLTAR